MFGENSSEIQASVSRDCVQNVRYFIRGRRVIARRTFRAQIYGTFPRMVFPLLFHQRQEVRYAAYMY